MTDVVVVRIDRKKISKLDAAARKRALSRSALVRQALDKFLENEPPQKGVGWPEHFARLRAKGRRVGSGIADEIRELDRNRWK